MSQRIKIAFKTIKKGGGCVLLLFIFALSTSVSGDGQGGVYKKPETFLAEVFSNQVPKVSAIWLTGNIKQQVKNILGHPYNKLRVKYWIKGNRSAWILDEIGKERPITTGIVINRGRIEQVKVLAFRESRGWEVKYPFFTNQFKGVAIRSVADTRLNKHIDGITGATLSVNALSVQARMALYLHQHVAK